MNISLDISHGNRESEITKIATIVPNQSIQLHTENTIINDDIILSLQGIKYYNGGVMPSYVEIPYTQDYTYTGELITPTWTNYDASIMSQSGTTSAIEAGTYAVTFTLLDPDLQWSDNTSAPKTINWNIIAASIPIPYAKPILYTGSSQLPQWINFDTTKIDKIGETPQIEINKYPVVFHLKNTNYKWEDNTSADKTIYWEISHYVVTYLGENTWEMSDTEEKPTTTPELYDGVYQSNNEYSTERLAGSWPVKIEVTQCENFTVYIRSYAGARDYTMATHTDIETIPTSRYTSATKTYTGAQRSGTEIGDYTEVKYTELNSEYHYFYIIYCRTRGYATGGRDKGYLLIQRP